MYVCSILYNISNDSNAREMYSNLYEFKFDTLNPLVTASRILNGVISALKGQTRCSNNIIV